MWAFELTGMPRDWFCRSSIYAVAGGTVFTTIFTVVVVFSQPQGRIKNPLLALWAMAAYPDPGFSPAWSKFWLIGTPALFLVGWGISRGANMQKYTFKRWPERKFLGLIEPESIEAGDRKILCSVLWGVARHFNYLGEGFLSLSIALVFGHFTNLWAWTYFVFIVTLFTIRQVQDDRRCAEKYGPEKWAEYQARVKYRIIPGIY